jgi:hypothetical protein
MRNQQKPSLLAAPVPQSKARVTTDELCGFVLVVVGGIVAGSGIACVEGLRGMTQRVVERPGRRGLADPGP